MAAIITTADGRIPRRRHLIEACRALGTLAPFQPNASSATLTDDFSRTVAVLTGENCDLKGSADAFDAAARPSPTLHLSLEEATGLHWACGRAGVAMPASLAQMVDGLPGVAGMVPWRVRPGLATGLVEIGELMQEVAFREEVVVTATGTSHKDRNNQNATTIRQAYPEFA
jgi:hypothetical protein